MMKGIFDNTHMEYGIIGCKSDYTVSEYSVVGRYGADVESNTKNKK